MWYFHIVNPHITGNQLNTKYWFSYQNYILKIMKSKITVDDNIVFGS